MAAICCIKTSSELNLWGENYHQRVFERGRGGGGGGEFPLGPSLTSHRLCCWASCLLAVCSGHYNSLIFFPLSLSVFLNALQVMLRPSSDSTRGSPSRSDQTWRATRNSGRKGEPSLCLCCSGAEICVSNPERSQHGKEMSFGTERFLCRPTNRAVK